MGAVYENEYDLLGRKVREIDANKNATEYIYDKLGRVIQKNIPFDNKTGEMSVVKYEYDKNGNVITAYPLK